MSLEAAGKFLGVVDGKVVALDAESSFTKIILDIKDPSLAHVFYSFESLWDMAFAPSRGKHLQIDGGCYVAFAVQVGR